MTFSATPSPALVQAHELFANVDPGITENVIIRAAFLAMANYSVTADRITAVGLMVLGYDDNASTRAVFNIEKHLSKLVRAKVLRSDRVKGITRYELNLKF